MNDSIKHLHFINFSRKLVINTLFFLIPLYFLKIGFNGWQIGLVSAPFAFAPLFFSFPIGWINDRFSIRRIIQISLAILACLLMFIGKTNNFLVMAVIFLLLGGANNALETSINSMYYKDNNLTNPNKKYASLNFWMSIGAAIGVLSGGILTYYADFNMLFLVYALFLSLVLFSAYCLPEVKFQNISISEYKKDLLNQKTILFSILIFLFTTHWGVEQTIYSPFLKEMFHLNNLYLAYYISLPLFVLAISSLSVGYIKYSPRINKWIFLLAMFLSGLGHILMVHHNIYVSFLFRVIHEIGDGFIAVLIFVYISRLFEQKSIGGSSGVLIAIMTLGHVFGTFIFSPLGHSMGLQYPFIISGLLMITDTALGWYVFFFIS